MELLKVVTEGVRESQKFFENNVDCSTCSNDEKLTRETMTCTADAMNGEDFTAFCKVMLNRGTKKGFVEAKKEEIHDFSYYPKEIYIEQSFGPEDKKIEVDEKSEDNSNEARLECSENEVRDRPMPKRRDRPTNFSQCGLDN